jgi:hypothetical protein
MAARLSALRTSQNLPPGFFIFKDSRYSFLFEAESTTGPVRPEGQFKKSTSSGLEPATFQLAAWYLNHYATECPIRSIRVSNEKGRLLRIKSCLWRFYPDMYLDRLRRTVISLSQNIRLACQILNSLPQEYESTILLLRRRALSYNTNSKSASNIIAREFKGLIGLC